MLPSPSTHFFSMVLALRRSTSSAMPTAPSGPILRAPILPPLRLLPEQRRLRARRVVVGEPLPARERGFAALEHVRDERVDGPRIQDDAPVLVRREIQDHPFPRSGATDESNRCTARAAAAHVESELASLTSRSAS